MAGDWIKVNKSLFRDPRVVRISSALKADRLRTVGGLLSAWCLFDEQTEDGRLDGYTPDVLDELVNFPGLASAMESVGWLEVGDGFLVVPRFFEHNGQSAKRRAQDVVRKMSARKADKCPQTKRTNCGLEKRREEKSKVPPNPQGGNGEAGELFDDQPKPERCLPAGWQKMSAAERKQAPVLQNTAAMVEIGSWFGRKPTTLWRVAEAVALKTASPSPEDIAALADYYTLEIDKDADYRRRDVLTLLNNWAGEMDRARIWKASNP